MRLRDIIEDKDITQKEFADYLQIRQNRYSQYETGQHQLSMDTFVTLALFFWDFYGLYSGADG